MSVERSEDNVVEGKRRRACREQRQQQLLHDTAEFSERMRRLSDDLIIWLAGREVSITLREGGGRRNGWRIYPTRHCPSLWAQLGRLHATGVVQCKRGDSTER